MKIKSRFMELYNLVMERVESSLDSRRQGLLKIDKMSTKKFLDFLREILPLFKENQLDLDKVTITEKPDGSAIRLIMKDGNLLFESAYSGVVEWDRMPFPEQSGWMKENLEEKLRKIREKMGFDYKIIGELIWCDSMVENGKVTPVGASYLADKFGEKGGIIIIDLKKIENEALIDLDDEEFKKLTSLLKGVSNSDFIFYSKQEDMKFSQSITLSFDVNQLIELLKRPEYNKERYTIKDKAIIDEVDKIQTEFLDQLEDIVNSTTGHFSAEGDLIEGLVLTVLDTHKEYGVFSRGYKAMKEKYQHYSTDMESLYNNLLVDVFGYQILSKIREHYDPAKYDEYKQKFDSAWPVFMTEFKKQVDELENDNSVPLAAKTTQLRIAKRKLIGFDKIKTFDEMLARLRVGVQNEIKI